MMSATKVLVVDDNQEILDCLAASLRERGYFVSTASSTEEACDFLDSETYDLLLSDIHMPLVDGLELAQMLRETKNPVISVAMSGENCETEAKECGFSAFLHKPFSEEELVNALRVAQLH